MNPEQHARESDNAQHLKMFRSLGSQQTPLSATQVRPMRSPGNGESVSLFFPKKLSRACHLAQVPDPEHLRSECSNSSSAWQGAIDFKNGKCR